MSLQLEFHIPIEPTPKGRPRFTKTGRAYTPAKTRQYETAVKRYVNHLYPRPALAGPLSLTLRFCLKRPKRPKHELPMVKPDLDNLAKAIKDALEGVLWERDQQIVDLYATKRYTAGEPCTHLIVKQATLP